MLASARSTAPGTSFPAPLAGISGVLAAHWLACRLSQCRERSQCRTDAEQERCMPRSFADLARLNTLCDIRRPSILTSLPSHRILIPRPCPCPRTARSWCMSGMPRASGARLRPAPRCARRRRCGTTAPARCGPTPRGAALDLPPQTHASARESNRLRPAAWCNPCPRDSAISVPAGVDADVTVWLAGWLAWPALDTVQGQIPLFRERLSAWVRAGPSAYVPCQLRNSFGTVMPWKLHYGLWRTRAGGPCWRR